MKQILVIVAVCSIGFVACNDDTTTTTKTKGKQTDYSSVTVNTDSESEKFSYSLGMIIGNTLKNSGIDSVDYEVINRAFEDDENQQVAYTIAAREVQTLQGEEIELSTVNKDILKRAIYDVLEADTTLLTIPEVSQAYQTFMQNNQTKVGQKNLDAGKAYLEGNKNVEGVQITDSGLQHQLIQEGTGEVPGKNDVVEVYFSGQTIAGVDFMDESEPSYVDLSEERAEFPGLSEGVRLYPAGSEFKLYVPSNLAFGANRVSPEVGPNSTVILHVTDVKILDAEKRNQYREAKKAYMKQLEQMQRQQMGR